MARLSQEEIENLLNEKGFKIIDISQYKNLKSDILIECEKGHKIQTNLETFRKSSFYCPSCLGNDTNNIQDTIPEKQEGVYRIIALDQASHKIGLSIYDDGKLVYYNLIEVIGDFEIRVCKIFKMLNETIIPFWKPDFLSFEDIQLQNDNVSTFKMLSMVLGVCELAATLHGIPHTETLNTVWQQKFNIKGGRRNQQKREVMHKVKEIYGIDVTDDVADAILLGNFTADKLKDKWFKSDF